jgi:O-antigen ligase
MFAITLFLVCLVIAPQLWLGPFVGLPTDFIAFPVLIISVVLSGRLVQFVRFAIHDLLFLAFYIWMAISALFNGLTPASLDHLVNYFKWFVLFKLVVALLPDLRRLRAFATLIVVLVTILGIEVLFHRFSPDGRGWAGQTFSWIDPAALAAGEKGRARWVGIFDGPGVFCVLFTIALPFVLVRLTSAYELGTRLLALALTALFLVATYFIGSRGGLLATVAIIGILIAIKTGVSIRHIIIFGGVIAVLFSLAPSYLTTVQDSSNSTQYRVEMWAQGLDMMKHDPVMGIGRGNFREYTGKLIAHNSAIEIGGEMGLVGLFLWFAMIYFSIRSVTAAGVAAADPKDKDFYLALTLAVIGYVASAMFVTLEYETWYLLLAACAAVERYAPRPVAIRKRDYVLIGSSVLGFIALTQVFAVLYMG